MDNLKEMYREYLDGKTDIETVSKDEMNEMALNPDKPGDFISEDNGIFNALTVFETGSSYIDSFASEGLAVGWLKYADTKQLDLVNRVRNDAMDKGQAFFENMEDALLSPAPEVKPAPTSIDETMRSLNPNRASQIVDELYIGNGVYDPMHSVYAKPELNAGDELASVTLYDVTLDDIEECMAHGTVSLADVPDQIHVVDGSPAIAKIDVDVYGHDGIVGFATAIASDARWCDEMPLDKGGLEHYREVEEKNYRIEKANGKEQPANERGRDSWRDGMVAQVVEQMDAIEGNGIVGERDASSVLCDMFREASGDWMADAGKEVLETYARADAAEQQGMANMFYALTGETFDTFLTEASRACEETLEAVPEDRGESLDEMMSAKDEEAVFGEDGPVSEKDDVDR